jgi:hypothetical protein
MSFCPKVESRKKLILTKWFLKRETRVLTISKSKTSELSRHFRSKVKVTRKWANLNKMRTQMRKQ